jgi:hypothetical protein
MYGKQAAELLRRSEGGHAHTAHVEPTHLIILITVIVDTIL